MKKEEPKLVIKSTYNYLYEFLNRNAITCLILVILGIIAVQADVLLYFIIILIAYIVFLVGSTIYNKLKYEANDFKFYNTKLVYTNSLIHHEVKEVEYKNIKEIRYSQLFLQMLFKLGTIYIRIDSDKMFHMGIRIDGVKNVKEEYEKLAKILNAK